MNRRKLLSRVKKIKEQSKPRVAPTGYHYMPDGTLMSDYEHNLLYGNPSSLPPELQKAKSCLLYTSDAADE